MNAAGRVCAHDYSLPRALFEGAPVATCDTVYVAGGIYGNIEAMKALDRLVEPDQGALLVFNGDMHWFDKTPQDFMAVEKRAQAHRALIGNVEAELRRDHDVGVGCGCAYPDNVAQDVVDRSNAIHRELKTVMDTNPELKDPLIERPCVAVMDIKGQRVAITHGDERMLGGWNCSRESLSLQKRRRELASWMRSVDIDVLATTHTCAPAACAWEDGAVINNGASGMPNFRGSLYGIVSRISVSPHEDALYRANVGSLFIEALPLCYDTLEFLRWFDDLWPTGTPAACSYRKRISESTGDDMKDALLGRFSLCDDGRGAYPSKHPRQHPDQQDQRDRYPVVEP